MKLATLESRSISTKLSEGNQVFTNKNNSIPLKKENKGFFISLSIAFRKCAF